MSEKLLNDISIASTETKSSISDFLKKLYVSHKKESNQDENARKEIFDRVTSDITITKAREVSKDERSERLLANHQFNYGQISFSTVYQIFEKVRKLRNGKQKQIFYDLGSGTGKVVFAAALCFPFLRCVGIQLLQSLYKFSKSLQERIQKQKKNIETQIKRLHQSYKIPSIEFMNGDFKQTNWCDGSIIFVSSTCYSKEVMQQIEKLCGKLQVGTIVVTLTRKLQSIYGVELKQSFEGSTSWGNTTIFVHMKQI